MDDTYPVKRIRHTISPASVRLPEGCGEAEANREYHVGQRTNVQDGKWAVATSDYPPDVRAHETSSHIR